MKIVLITVLCFTSFCIDAQTYQDHRGTIVKWDLGRLFNPYNSTIQLGAEFGLTKSLTIHSDVGINSNLFEKKTHFNRGIFISHNQFRKYMKKGNFYGIDLFYIHAKDFSATKCFRNKKDGTEAHYDSVTLIKNVPGGAIIFGNESVVGRFTFDIYLGAGIRQVNNRITYLRQNNSGIECDKKWIGDNDDEFGIFSAPHFSFGIKLGYILKRKKTN